jgi:hypothetical protein
MTGDFIESKWLRKLTETPYRGYLGKLRRAGRRVTERKRVTQS